MVVTQQVIRNLYDKYRGIEVSFNREVSKTTGLQPKKLALKFKDITRPCILYASSMESSKIIFSLPRKTMEEIRKNKTNAALRFSFLRNERPKPVELNFFVQGHLLNIQEYASEQQDLYLASLVFTSRPPDDLIETIGFLLEANVNAAKRKEERIPITEQNIPKLNLESKNCQVKIDGIPRKGILRDVSFSALKVIIPGNAKFLINKTAEVTIKHLKEGNVLITGSILRFEEVEGRRDLAAIVVKIHLSTLPLNYKVMINDFLYNR